MIRKLAFALTLISMGIANSVHALGLGEVSVSSALNQPLKAEIELVSVKGLGIEEILPGLATREEFLRAGVDRVYFLSDLRFEVEKHSDGKAVIVLTTTKPVREPFLNFLVEVIWPSGRLLREYALLIDPPLFTEEPARPVAAPSVPAPEQSVSEQTVPVASTPSRGDRVAMPAKPAERASVTGTYGPTNSRDTLWDIAIKARPNRSVSPQQVMLAIQDLNPDAFINGNINKLKAGQILRLPDVEQIRQRSASAAINEVIAQNEMAQGKKRKTMASAAKVDVKSSGQSTVSSGDELKLVVPENNSGAMSSSANAGDSAVSGSGRGADNELAVTLEKLDKSNLERDELSGKVKDLEEQLATLQRLLTLKNDQLATIQAQARQSELEQAKAEQMAAEEAATNDAEVAEASIQPSEEQANVVEQEGVAEQNLEQPDAAQVQTPAEAVAQEASAQAEEAKPEAVAKPKPVKKAPVAQPEPAKATESIFDLILNNPLYQALVAGGLILLLIILWAVSRSNAKREEQALEAVSEEPELDSFDEDYEEEQDELQDDDYEESDDADEEVSDTSSSEEGGEAESEDVIAEADVYVAYGRLDQAASVLEQGISADPIRTDYRLKLLEVYAETGDAEAFDRQLSELEAIQDPEAMERALEIKAGMSTTVPAENDLDYEAETLSTGSDDSLMASDEPASDIEPAEPFEEAVEDDAEVLDNSFDFDSVETDLEEDDLGIDLASEDLELDLDIDIESEEGEVSEEALSLDEEVVDHEAEPELAEDAGIDFEPQVIDTPELDEAESVEASAELSEEGDGIELQLDELELSEELEAESEIDIPDDLSIPDEMLDIEPTAEESADEAALLEDESESEAPADDEPIALVDEDEPALAESDEASIDADTLSLDDDLESALADTDAVVSDDILEEAEVALGEAEELEADDLAEDDDFDFLNGTDEASTKLDLARAYIDMGDVEGAKDILQEVEKEGSDEQKADARELLDSLGS